MGTLVLAYDEETGEKAYKPVVRLYRNITKEWYHIRMNGEEIVCTGGHPFYVLNAEEDRKIVRYEGVKSDKNGRWIEAKELKTSDKLLLSDGTCAIIENIKVEQLSEPETTYNFEVEDFHTYFVGENPVCVHNSGCGGDFKKYSVEEIAKRGDITTEQFHREVKPKILKISPKGLGKNPDILLNKENIVGLSSRIKKESYNTGKRLIEFIGR